MRKELGKIKKAEFGLGGYQDAMIGISFDLGGEGWGVSDFWGNWALERSEYAKWTEAERITQLGEMSMRIAKLLEDAKIRSVSKLAGIPIEVTFEGNVLKEWRVLKEVL